MDYKAKYIYYDSFQLKQFPYPSFLKDDFIKIIMFVVKEEVQKKFKVFKIKKEKIIEITNKLYEQIHNKAYQKWKSINLSFKWLI